MSSQQCGAEEVYTGRGGAERESDQYIVMEYDISSGKWVTLPQYRTYFFAMTVINASYLTHKLLEIFTTLGRIIMIFNNKGGFAIIVLLYTMRDTDLLGKVGKIFFGKKKV